MGIYKYLEFISESQLIFGNFKPTRNLTYLELKEIENVVNEYKYIILDEFDSKTSIHGLESVRFMKIPRSEAEYKLICSKDDPDPSRTSISVLVLVTSCYEGEGKEEFFHEFFDRINEILSDKFYLEVEDYPCYSISFYKK